jgi:transposase
LFRLVLEEVPMPIVGGCDIHRTQVTFDWVDDETGEAGRGRIAPAHRDTVRRWLGQFDGKKAEFVVEGCTGWRFVAEECHAAGFGVHVADPGEAATAIHGRKKRAKTDRIDARGLRQLLEQGRVPESWIPPRQVLEVRTKVRLYHDLMGERDAWQHRIQAILFHHGAVAQRGLLTGDRSRLHTSTALSPAGAETIETILRVIDGLDTEVERLRAQLTTFGSRQPGCRELQKEYGIGKLLSVVIWCELGDCRRFHSSDAAVRHTGLDVTVYSSNGKLAPPHLARQGPPLLRWALFEAGMHASRVKSPDHEYWQQVAERLDRKRASLSVARKLARRCHHRLRALGEEAFAEI